MVEPGRFSLPLGYVAVTNAIEFGYLVAITAALTVALDGLERLREIAPVLVIGAVVAFGILTFVKWWRVQVVVDPQSRKMSVQGVILSREVPLSQLCALPKKTRHLHFGYVEVRRAGYRRNLPAPRSLHGDDPSLAEAASIITAA